MSTKTYPIKGMHCASCVSFIEKAVGRLDGVTSCSVNLATEKATVTFDPKKVDDQKVAGAVSSVGYSLQQIEEGQEADGDQEKKEKLKQLNDLKMKVFISLFLGGLIVWGSFPGLMEYSPKFLREYLVKLLLALPVQFWAGLMFYKA